MTDLIKALADDRATLTDAVASLAAEYIHDAQEQDAHFEDSDPPEYALADAMHELDRVLFEGNDAKAADLIQALTSGTVRELSAYF